MGVTLRLITAILISAWLVTAAFAQTAPELFIFKSGTAIRADEVNANFQLLRDRIQNALGLTEITNGDLEELAALIEKLQGLAESGELNGTGLEFDWDGSKLGVRREGEEAFTYQELLGPSGPSGGSGQVGAGLEFEWNGTRLGVRAAGESEFQYVDLAGPQGAPGDPGTPGADGQEGPEGQPGTGLEFTWNGTELGVRQQGSSSYSFVDLVGPAGPAGDPRSYTAGAGIDIQNDVISLPASQTMPACANGYVPRRNGAGWECGLSVEAYFGPSPSGFTESLRDGNGSDCTIGDVWLTAGRRSGAMIADGRLLAVPQYSTLYSLIGARFGGDGIQTFALPDLTAVSPRSANGEPVHYVICTEGVFPGGF